ncbi:general odorant-binding protein 56a [Drosophila mauritiana]|uniref:General odorant-binding protein 56a n=1 Tax=Drosophila mauritiana TaxID=7226 RepID=A0A6P8JQK3_DROMA|nr:general odorant-binding protein 56a [Drosophila mauritiana]
MKVFLLFIFLSAIWLQALSMKPYEKVKACLKRQLGYTVTANTKLDDKEDSLQSKCFYHCLLEVKGVIANDAISSEQPRKVLVKKYGITDTDELEKAEEKCHSVKATGKCELGYKIFKCYQSITKH